MRRRQGDLEGGEGADFEEKDDASKAAGKARGRVLERLLITAAAMCVGFYTFYGVVPIAGVTRPAVEEAQTLNAASRRAASSSDAVIEALDSTASIPSLRQQEKEALSKAMRLTEVCMRGRGAS